MKFCTVFYTISDVSSEYYCNQLTCSRIFIYIRHSRKLLQQCVPSLWERYGCWHQQRLSRVG